MLGTEYQVTMLTVLFSLLRALCCYYICYFVIERLPLSLLSYFPAHIISAAVAGRQSGREPTGVKLSAAVASIAAQEENSLTSIDWDKILTG